ncbi:MAG TPA: hypothetical protein VF137_02595 [Candidatus Dormibacteraeota bacterium]
MATAGVSAAAATTSLTPTSSYKILPAHAMLTEQGYKAAALRSTDFIPGVASVPFGGKMIYGGGPVLIHPKIYLTYWDWTSDPSGIKPYLTGFLRGVGGSNWLDSQSQYCQHVATTATGCDGGQPFANDPNQLAGVWDDNSDLAPDNPIAEPNTGNSPPLADEAVRAVKHFGYDPEGVYFIATPHGHSTAGFASNNATGYCAWHGGLELADGSFVRFVNMPYITDGGGSCGANIVNAGAQGLLDPVSVAAGHEYAETITDPNVWANGVALEGQTATGWYDPDPIGAETGDKCAYPIWNTAGLQGAGLPGEAVNITLNGKPYAVQPLWSNNANNYAGGCVTSYSPPAFTLPSLPSIPGSTPDNLSPTTCPGAQVSDRAFDAVDPYTTVNVTSSNQPSLDILNVQFSTPNTSTLEIKTTIDNLASFPQGTLLGGMYSVYWDYGGQTYVASVAVDPSGITYEDGVHVSSPQGVVVPVVGAGTGTSGNNDTYSNTNDTGSFNPGPNGTVVIDVPLSHVGSPPAGALLTKTWAVSSGVISAALSSSLPAVPGVGNHWVTFPSDLAPDDAPLNASPYTIGPFTGWPYEVGTATTCSHVRALPAPPIDTVKPKAPIALACGDLWAKPDHTASDILGNSAPQLTLLKGSMSMSPDGKSLQVRMTIKDLESTVPTGATGEDWYMVWNYKGTTYFSQVNQSALPGQGPTYGDGTVSGNQYNPANTDSGSFTVGPNGVVEVDVPLANVGNPPAAALLKQPVGETDTEYGLPGNPLTNGAGSLQKVDTGGPNLDYTVGSSCVRTKTFAASTSGHQGSGSGGTGAGAALAKTGLSLLGLLLGLLAVAVGSNLARSRGWTGSPAWLRFRR